MRERGGGLQKCYYKMLDLHIRNLLQPIDYVTLMETLFISQALMTEVEDLEVIIMMNFIRESDQFMCYSTSQRRYRRLNRNYVLP